MKDECINESVFKSCTELVITHAQAGSGSVYSQVTDILKLSGPPTEARYVKYYRIGTWKGANG